MFKAFCKYITIVAIGKSELVLTVIHEFPLTAINYSFPNISTMYKINFCICSRIPAILRKT